MKGPDTAARVGEMWLKAFVCHGESRNQGVGHGSGSSSALGPGSRQADFAERTAPASSQVSEPGPRLDSRTLTSSVRITKLKHESNSVYVLVLISPRRISDFIEFILQKLIIVPSDHVTLCF